MIKRPDSTVQLFSYDDDRPHEEKGALIPSRTPNHTRPSFHPSNVSNTRSNTGLRMTVAVLGLCAIVVLGSVGYDMVSRSNLVASPVVTIVDPYTQNKTTLDYGPEPALANNSFFIETKEAFVDEGLTFLTVDVPKKQLLFFKKGVLLQSADILGVGEAGSWWETPAGLYQVESKSEQTFSNLGQVYLPWQLTFQGNYLIHGWPNYPDGSEVMADFTGGGIRLNNQVAELLYHNVRIGIPILVHAQIENERDTFVYEPLVPEIDISHYFVADIENDTVLAADSINEVVPIASLTKLMTAVVASESINLDGRIKVISPTFVTSLIPRLSERSSVSVYSLLQLLLVESSNEAAETIAGEIGREEFIAAMNSKALQLGMMNTHFADPSGLSAGNTSSVGDLYRLVKYINKQRSFIFEITAEKELSSAYIGGEFTGLVNFNEVKDMDNFRGGKVGETIAAGQTSISLHELNFQGEDRLVVVILLGSEDRVEDIKYLISYVQNQFSH